MKGLVTEMIKNMLPALFLAISLCVAHGDSDLKEVKNAIVISTWNFTRATKAGWESLILGGGSALDAVVSGCSQCEKDQCDGTVGYGGSPDEDGETSLDAMIMDGATMDVGAVANLRDIKDASRLARMVLEHTDHTLLVGSSATKFALSMGFEKSNLSTYESMKMWHQWKKNTCQPNFWKNVNPDPSKSCGPYKPIFAGQNVEDVKESPINTLNHDTIGVVSIDFFGNVAAGTSTNGAKFKIPGRVGDSPIVGSGAYSDNEVGGAVGTGDGDLMMRFLPSFHAVELMRNGASPTKASQIVIQRIAKFYTKFFGAVISVSRNGDFGAACHGMSSFSFTVMRLEFDEVRTFQVECMA